MNYLKPTGPSLRVDIVGTCPGPPRQGGPPAAEQAQRVGELDVRMDVRGALLRQGGVPGGASPPFGDGALGKTSSPSPWAGPAAGGPPWRGGPGHVPTMSTLKDGPANDAS